MRLGTNHQKPYCEATPEPTDSAETAQSRIRTATPHTPGHAHNKATRGGTVPASPSARHRREHRAVLSTPRQRPGAKRRAGTKGTGSGRKQGNRQKQACHRPGQAYATGRHPRATPGARPPTAAGRDHKFHVKQKPAKHLRTKHLRQMTKEENEKRLAYLKSIVSRLPEKPGSYQYYDEHGTISMWARQKT